MLQIMWKGRCLPQDNTTKRKRYKPHALARLDLLDHKRRAAFFLIEARRKSN
jgi:hypothetical protein